MHVVCLVVEDALSNRWAVLGSALTELAEQGHQVEVGARGGTGNTGRTVEVRRGGGTVRYTLLRTYTLLVPVHPLPQCLAAKDEVAGNGWVGLEVEIAHNNTTMHVNVQDRSRLAVLAFDAVEREM